MTINKTMLAGNITRDAELKALTGKPSVLNFSIAVNSGHKNAQTGEFEERVDFFDCVMFGTRAEGIAPYMTKGTKLAIAGRLRQDRWTDKETGQNRSRVNILVDDVEFMSSRNKNDMDTQQPVSQQQAVVPQPANMVPASAYASEDLPF